MNGNHGAYLVFTKVGERNWRLSASATELQQGEALCDEAVAGDLEFVRADRAVLFEVGGQDAVPHFIYRHASRK